MHTPMVGRCVKCVVISFGVGGLALLAQAKDSEVNPKSGPAPAEATELPRYPYGGGSSGWRTTTPVIRNPLYGPENSWALYSYPEFVSDEGARGTLFHELPSSEADLVCLPPPPIPLGMPFAGAWSSAPGSVERQLADVVYEVFYSPLSTRLLNGSLEAEQRVQLDAYLGERKRQLEALRGELLRTEGLGVAERVASLQAFSLKQTPALQKLEAEAEALRSGLFRKGLSASLLGTGSWRERRAWTVQDLESDATDKERLYAGFVVLRSAAFDQEGLGAAQRRLLLDAALVRGRLLQKVVSGAEVPAPLFFSPEGAQVFLPEGMPANLREQLQAYAAEKERVREGLVAQVLALDSASEKRRKAALEAFCSAQADGLRALENKAEQLRLELAKQPGLFAPKSRLQLPETLRGSLADLARERRRLAGEYAAEYEQLRRGVMPARLEPLGQGTAAASASTLGMLKLSAVEGLSDKQQKLQAEMVGVFNERQKARHAGFRQKEAALEPACKAWLATAEGKASGLTAEQLLLAVQREVVEADTWAAQSEYRQAVLQPGLSLEQRRLLFGAALGDLGLPLPRPE